MPLLSANRTGDERHSRVVAIVVIVIFFLLSFGPTMLSGKFLITGDAYYQSYPFRMIAWSAIKHGELPLWTPAIFSGYPLFSMAQIAIAYPLTWGYLFLPGHWAELIVVMGPFLIGPLLIYFYGIEVRLSPLAALLAGLSFTYGGNVSSKLGAIGLNSEIWLPLFLIALERSRGGQFLRPFLLATTAYLLSVLAGQPQGFLLVGLIAIAYGCFLGVYFKPRRSNEGPDARWLKRWQPLIVAVAAILLASGLSAFQILETLPAVQQSVRSSLSFEIFTGGSFTFGEALRSLLAPSHHYIEVSTYVAPVAFLLAIHSFVRLRDRFDPRVVFWLVMSATAFLLMLGSNTPLYRLLFHIPIFNLFRYPSRHAFEWSFALSMLSGYGLDALRARVNESVVQPHKFGALLAWGLLIVATIVAGLWWRAALLPPLQQNFGLDSGLIPSQSEHTYWIWKLIFTSLVIASGWFALKTRNTEIIKVLPLGVLMLALFIEPQIYFAHVWFPFAKSKEQFTVSPPVEQWLQSQHTNEPERIYSRVNLFARDYWKPPALDLANMTAVRGLENVAGYEQLISERYSRALGDVGPDAVNKRYGLSGTPDASLFSEKSHVLDLLNTRYVLSFTNLSTAPEQVMRKENIELPLTDLTVNLPPGKQTTLTAESGSGDELILVTSLSSAVGVSQNSRVVHIRVVDEDDNVVEGDLEAGRDTSEWAHERVDVRTSVKHQLAPVFDSRPGDAEGSFAAFRYWSRLSLGKRISVKQVEVTNISGEANVAIWKAVIHDSKRSTSSSLRLPVNGLSSSHWQPVKKYDEVVVWRNNLALPRAWLTTRVESVTEDEALRRVRGESETTFDPKVTALLELPERQLPPVSSDAIDGLSARVTHYTPNSLTIETSATSATVLVVSEMYYSGWEAKVDGVPKEILRTDYLLRGVTLGTGSHTIVMNYTAPGARNGLIISLVTLLIIVVLVLLARRHRATAF